MSSATTQNIKTDDKLQIEATIAQFIQAFQTGDLDALLATYSDDLIKARADHADESKAQTAARIARGFEEYDRELVVWNDEIIVSGDLAYVRGILDLTLVPRNGSTPQHVRRRFLEIWRKEEDGRWRVARTMDNRDTP
jgi:ketosteroid isomerase-like protein